MATKINTIITKFLKQKKEELLQKQKIENSIKSILNTQTKKHLYSIRVYKKTLVIYTDSSASSFQLNLLRNAILEKVRDILPTLEMIKIKVGGA